MDVNDGKKLSCLVNDFRFVFFTWNDLELEDEKDTQIWFIVKLRYGS